MNEVLLIKPSIVYKPQYFSMIEEWKVSGEKLIPWVLRLDHSDFYGYIKYLNILENGVNLLHDSIKYNTFWLVSQGKKIIGVSNIGDDGNGNFFENSGHISYGIRPSERGKGYGTELLRLSLSEACKMGTEKIYITCAENNKASEKVILKNKGVFCSKQTLDNTMVKKFFIKLKS